MREESDEGEKEREGVYMVRQTTWFMRVGEWCCVWVC